MANQNPINQNIAPMFAFQQQMEERDRERNRFPLEQAATRANIGRTRALTDLTKAQTTRNRETLETDKELKRQELANLQLQHDINKSNLNTKQLNRKYALQAAAGHSMLKNLEQGNTQAATQAFEKFVNDYKQTFGEEPPIANKVRQNGLSAQDIPKLTAMTDISLRNAKHLRDSLKAEQGLEHDKERIRTKGTEQRKSIRTRGDESRKTLDAEYDLKQDLAEFESEFGTVRDPLAPKDLNNVRQNVVYDVVNTPEMQDQNLTVDASGHIKGGNVDAQQDAEYATNQITTITDYMHRKGVPDPQGRAANWWNSNFEYKDIKEDTMDTSIWTNEPEVSAWVPRNRQERKDLFERIKKTMDNYPDMSNQEKKEMMEYNLRLYHNYKIKRALTSEVNY